MNLFCRWKIAAPRSYLPNNGIKADCNMMTYNN